MLAGHVGHEPAESWDDDFEFQPAPNPGIRNTNEPENWDDDFDDSPSPTRPRAAHSSPKRMRSRRSATTSTRDAEENWDAEFALTNSPIKHRPHAGGSFELDDDTDDDADFGYADREEDRTVTARSRRAAATPARSAAAKASPPPPVPAIPLPLRNSSTTNIPGANGVLRSPPLPLIFPTPFAHALTTEQPFPRSPSASVFSVPATVASSGAADSTTHLAPRRSNDDGEGAVSTRRTGGVFSALPPSPQIHRERERRRLRKKSRPEHPGGSPAYTRTRGRSGSVDLPDGWVIAEEDRERARSVSVSGSASANSSANASGHEDEGDIPEAPRPLDPVETPDKDSKSNSLPLLTRLGSVGKRWSVRARRGKRASTAPEDVAALDEEGQGSIKQDILDDVFSVPGGSGTQDGFEGPLVSSQAPIAHSPPRRYNYTDDDDDDDDYDGAFAHEDDLPHDRDKPLNDREQRNPTRIFLRNDNTQDHDHTPRAKLRPAGTHAVLHPTSSGISAPPSPSPARTRRSSAAPSSIPPPRDTRTSVTSPLLPSPVTKQRSWFFRVASGSGSGGSSPGESDALLAENSPAVPPSKLVKRKSLGFVHLGRGHAAAQAQATGGDSASNSVPPPLQPQIPNGVGDPARRAAYAVLGLGSGPPSSNGKPSVQDPQRKRTWSVSRSKDQGESASEAGAESDADAKWREKEGSRSFMGGMRRLSLVPAAKRAAKQAHKRNQSSASVTTMDIPSGSGGLANSHEGDSQVPPLPDDTKGDDRSVDGDQVKASAQVSVLLPPIELQPPSPPRDHQSTRAMSISTSLPASLALLPPGSTTASPLPTIASEPSSTRPSPTSTLHSFNPSTPKSPHATLAPEVASLIHSPSASSVLTASPALRKGSPRPAGSPQAASLGRGAGTVVRVAGSSSGTMGSSIATLVPRRNSLGDLKIPARISQAQVGLRRDLVLVKEFAANVENLKNLRCTYDALVSQVQSILDMHAQLFAQQSQLARQSRASSPLFNIGRRNRSNTTPPATVSQHAPTHQVYKDLASAFYTINSKYRLSWECAELLIELGGGAGGSEASPRSAPSTSVSAPAVPGSATDNKSNTAECKKSRERAITLAGDESKPPTPTPGSAPFTGETTAGPPIATPSNTWRASTGRHDLSQRQMFLLKEMLSSPEPSASALGDSTVNGDGPATGTESLDHTHGPPRSATTPSPGPWNSPVFVNREWRWGDAMNSTITLPSEEASASGHISTPHKKRGMSRLGMRGIRDMLRALKRSAGVSFPMPHGDQHAQSGNPSTVSLATESSVESRDGHRCNHPHIHPVSMLPPPLVPPSDANTRGRRRAKTSIGPESMRVERDSRPSTPFGPSSFAAKASPRRPSLASIFRLGQKGSHKSTAAAASTPNMLVSNLADTSMESSSSSSVGGRASRQSTTDGDDEEDWDHLETSGDMDATVSLGVDPSTIRGHAGHSLYQDPSKSRQSSRPMTSRLTWNSSRSSLLRESDYASQLGDSTRTTRAGRSAAKAYQTASSIRPPSRRSQMAEAVIVGGASALSGLPKSGSVRSMPPQHSSGIATATTPAGLMPNFKLALTPDNIGPLLENAKVVYKQLDECITEIRTILTRVGNLSV